MAGETLDRYAARAVFAPLGMRDTEFRPQEDGVGRGRVARERIAPSETRNGAMVRGTVHDPRAFALGGVAGHAGLFGTADDLARYATAILSGGGRVLSPAGVASMTTPRVYGDHDLRALGWDVDTGYSSVRGDLFPIGSFGHTGWTGTSLWIDPVTGVYVVLLTSRVTPTAPARWSRSGRGGPDRRLGGADAPEACSAALSELVLPRAPRAIAPRPEAAAAATLAPAVDVRAGVDVLDARGFAGSPAGTSPC